MSDQLFSLVPGRVPFPIPAPTEIAEIITLSVQTAAIDELRTVGRTLFDGVHFVMALDAEGAERYAVHFHCPPWGVRW